MAEGRPVGLKECLELGALVIAAHDKVKENAGIYQELNGKLDGLEKMQKSSSTKNGANLAWRRRRDVLSRMEVRPASCPPHHVRFKGHLNLD